MPQPHDAIHHEEVLKDFCPPPPQNLLLHEVSSSGNFLKHHETKA